MVVLGIGYMLVRLKVLVVELVLVVLINEHVVLQSVWIVLKRNSCRCLRILSN